jgi:hypothetical protein
LATLHLPGSCRNGILIQVADKRKIIGKEYNGIQLSVDQSGKKFKQELTAISALIAYDLILGKDWLDSTNPDIDWPTNTLTFAEHRWQCNPPRPIVEHISVHTLRRTIRKGIKNLDCGLILYNFVTNELNNIQSKTTAEQNEADAEAVKSLPQEIQKLINKYQATVFSTYEELPPSRPQDHKIELTDITAKPFSRPIYPLSEVELQALKDELDFLINQGRIRPSTSAYGAPVFYVKQKGKLRLVFDYRGLNRNTVKSVAAIPNIQEMFDRLAKAKYSSKFDLASGYHQIRIHPSDIPKTAFRTKYGFFEWTVMSFGLSNAPATFQSMVNAILQT